MKTRLLSSLCLLLSLLGASASVIRTPNGLFVQGAIEGDGAILQRLGETVDYLTFEVTARTAVRLIGTDTRSSIFLAIAEVFPNNELTNAGQPYLLFYNSSPTLPELTLLLDPGLFAIQVAVEEFHEGNLANTFIPAEDSNAIITIPAKYSFILEGQFQGLDFMGGNLDRTFTITHIPEPTVSALLFIASGAGLIRRMRQKEG